MPAWWPIGMNRLPSQDSGVRALDLAARVGLVSVWRIADAVFVTVAVFGSKNSAWAVPVDSECHVCRGE